jgi:hypothetical protein
MPQKASDFLVNPTGNFVVGGPDGDCGLTGRKIIVDTYGGYAPHGGGAFSGKDPTKVDRSAAYAARYLAKNVVAAGLADRCTIQVAYAIGVADPMSVLVDTHGTGKVEEKKLEKVLPEIFRLTPTNIRRTLKLNRPIYKRTASYGHFGRAPDRDGGFSWEQTNLASELKGALREQPASRGTHRTASAGSGRRRSRPPRTPGESPGRRRWYGCGAPSVPRRGSWRNRRQSQSVRARSAWRRCRRSWSWRSPFDGITLGGASIGPMSLQESLVSSVLLSTAVNLGRRRGGTAQRSLVKPLI